MKTNMINKNKRKKINLKYTMMKLKSMIQLLIKNKRQLQDKKTQLRFKSRKQEEYNKINRMKIKSRFQLRNKG